MTADPAKDAERLARIRERHPNAPIPSEDAHYSGCDYCFLVGLMDRLTQERDEARRSAEALREGVDFAHGWIAGLPREPSFEDKRAAQAALELARDTAQNLERVPGANTGRPPIVREGIQTRGPEGRDIGATSQLSAADVERAREADIDLAWRIINEEPAGMLVPGRHLAERIARELTAARREERELRALDDLSIGNIERLRGMLTGALASNHPHPNDADLLNKLTAHRDALAARATREADAIDSGEVV